MEAKLRELLREWKARKEAPLTDFHPIVIALVESAFESCIADLTALLEEYGMNDLEDK